ncbi:selenoprotein K-like isoform X1 [Pectinophora gossypiella]|uniref:selenoprotein K-like isoform X1 n=1 Tax=Pectinophora gossypiella TaxID=13191 RepID=UPI00214F4D91|nr:selenoprotein K-like isoform X1 [Pectinophora gossypiella]
MVYVKDDGTVVQQAPFSVFGWFWGILNFFYLLFQTLINPNFNKHGDKYVRDFRPPGHPNHQRANSVGSDRRVPDLRPRPWGGAAAGNIATATCHSARLAPPTHQPRPTRIVLLQQILYSTNARHSNKCGYKLIDR